MLEYEQYFSIDPDGTNLCAAPRYPVYTAGHGDGRWDPKPIAVSLDGLRAALAAVTKAAEGRETPVALEQRPISAEEREDVLAQIQQHNP
jgi:hypothetical protein